MRTLFTIATLLFVTDFEALFFSDGHAELRDPGRDFEESPTLPQYILPVEQVRKLREMLNRPEIVRILEQE